MTSKKGQPQTGGQCAADFAQFHPVCDTGGGAGRRGTSLCFEAIIEPHKLDIALLLTKTNGILCESIRLRLAY